ncbi:MAG: hypothetical protein AAF734_09320 [Bacteroidota bacterium]
MREIYQDVPEKEMLSLIDFEGVDEFIAERAAQLGGCSPDEIPSGIPKTHWWWWLD